MQLSVYFLSTLEDLRDRIAKNKSEFDYEYSLLKAAGLLRLLLVDETPLLHTVNRHYRLKMLFEIGKVEPVIGITFWQAGDMLDPEWYKRIYGADSQVQTVKLDEFLALPVLATNYRAMTVIDTVRFFANQEGGVHRQFNLATEPELQWFRDIELQVRIDECQPGLMMIAVIGRIVLSALADLERRVRADYYTSSTSSTYSMHTQNPEQRTLRAGD